MKEYLINFSMSRPRTVILLALVITLFTLVLAGSRVLQAPDAIIDTDPENMLKPDEAVRVFHTQTKEKFGLFDMVAMGIYHPGEQGVFVPEVLAAINNITNEILDLEHNDFILEANGDTLRVDLTFEREIASEVDGIPAKKKVREHGIIFEDLMALNQIEDINGESGDLVIRPLMPAAPQTHEAALALKRRIDLNPLLSDKLAAKDGKVIGIYIPIKSKKISYNLSLVLDALAQKHLGNLKIDGKPFFGTVEHPIGEYFIAGIPVAQDTFGKYMFDQMGVSAPLAGLVIFILLFVFFKNVRVILAPMLLAILAITWTMALLVGTGFTVHIMSSMIPIFLFPISVLNSIHIISSIHKNYGRHANLQDTMRATLQTLFKPILFTTITTVVGFVSLVLTFIPPVQVFGMFVGLGVALSWLLSVTFLPAYLILAGEKTFRAFGHEPDSEHGVLGKVAMYLRWISQHYSRAVLVVSTLLFILAAYGISRIEINDNPVKWFKKGHPLRHASEVMNAHVAGTYMANIVFDFDSDPYADYANPATLAQVFAWARSGNIAEAFYSRESGQIWGVRKAGVPFKLEIEADSTAMAGYAAALRQELEAKQLRIERTDSRRYLDEEYEEIDLQDMLELADTGTPAVVFFNEADRVFFGTDAGSALRFYFEVTEELVAEQLFDDLLLALVDGGARLADTDEPFKNPRLLKYMQKVQVAAEGNRRVVGGVSSILDILKKVSWELRGRDDRYFRLPQTKVEAGQYLFLAQGGESPDDIYKFITRDFDSAHLWLHLNTGDNKNMESVIARVDDFIAKNKPPKGVQIEWAGLNYINSVWQQKMVGGMANSLIGAYLTVFLMVVFLFRSIRWGIIAMIPLTLTIALIYAMIGLVGKSYDMPIAVLSSLTLGLSIDFGIHYIERSRLIHKSTGNFRRTMKLVFGEPATAMLQNTLAIAIGFVPLFFADLVPYQTVGAFFFAIMLISGISTLIILPAISKTYNKTLYKPVPQPVAVSAGGQNSKLEQVNANPV